MAIGCLGWGSLIWDPQGLPVTKNDWNTDGPSLPIEFSRMSGEDRITLVVRDGGPTVSVLWCELPYNSVAEAANQLRRRERTKQEWIGRWPNDGSSSYLHAETIEGWAQEKGLEGVVWTAIPSKWNERDYDAPSLEYILQHLRALGKRLN